MQSQSLAHILSALESLAPLSLAQPWDKVGLHVAGDGRPIRRICLAIDLLPEVLEDAAKGGADLCVSYHPLLFKPMERLDGSTWQSRVAMAAVRNGIAVYSPHTALDGVRDGVNDWLIAGLGAGTVAPLQHAAGVEQTQEYRVVVFVPVDAVDRVREAMSASGAGHVGDYSECSFGAMGVGTFLPGASTNPAIGARGKLERVSEVRLEMPCARGALAPVLAALRIAHPYEEPLFDVTRMEARVDATQGVGRVMDLASTASGAELAARAKAYLRVASIQRSSRIGQSDTEHRRVAVCAGSGGSMLDAVVSSGATLFLTGEMSHHEVIAARERGVEVLLAGHTNTERGYLPRYADRLRAAGAGRGISLEVFVSAADQEVLHSV